VVERFTRSADGHELTVESTWEDAASNAAPYLKTTVLTFADDMPRYDFQCEDVGDKFGPAYGGGVE
jgi:hypothetical protein